MSVSEKPVIFSGIQPSGHLTLGGYLGALRNWVRLQHDYECLYCVVDLHAITVRQDADDLAFRRLSFPAQYIAAGLDPQVSLIFLQSMVSAHSELAWLLTCNSYMGELSRMTQFKGKTQGKSDKNIGVGLYSYPILMAADILLYQTALVPVGADQKQHLELTRDLAIRMNNRYGQLFTVPEPYIGKVGARVMSLQEPTAKMSKSDANEQNYISMLDSAEVIQKKVRRAVMDSIVGISYDPDNRPGVANLLSIYAALTDIEPAAAVELFVGKGNADLKNAVTEVIIESLRPFQQRYHELMDNKDYLRGVLADAAEKARQRAKPTLEAVSKAIGLRDLL